ncbi:hypothetical protein CCACVL1_15403 [Corchorus capsularis]|uniref:F-box domain-containing protein n=1 Tax=Corchorus capsularis TaxID=210143 RepID=A0A1R3I2I5_COCAP|nr:hypothetical protein CCACVL1_15403 [Corchorus capsularis]
MEIPHVYHRFSDLPEDIVLHVFSFLDYGDIVRLSSISRKFQKICSSGHNLLFKLDFDDKSCTATCKKFKKFLKDSVAKKKCKKFKGFESLDLHNAPEIQRLGLHWFCHCCRYDSKKSSFMNWLQYALRNKVQELDIAVPVTADHKPFKFPAAGRDQFTSLKVLKLKLQRGESNLLALEMPSLEALSLTSVSVDSLKFGEWVSSNSCKSLKVLNLEEFRGIYDLNISSSSLKAFTLVSCARHQDGNFNIISCSSLEKLSITKCAFGNFKLMNSPSLKGLQISNCKFFNNFDINIISAEQLQTFTLTMNLSFWTGNGSINLHNSLSLRDAVISVEPNRNFTHNDLFRLMNDIRYAKSLQLSFQTIQALSHHDQWPKFEYLEHLEVTGAELNLYKIATIAAFLVELCSLNTLTLRFNENATQLSEIEVANKICSEVEKHGVESNYLKIICTAKKTKRNKF